jgi:hypothetical protein
VLTKCLIFATCPYDGSKCFGSVIDAWSKADDQYQTAEIAESVLNRLEDVFLHNKSNNPKEMLSNIAYNSGEPNLSPI